MTQFCKKLLNLSYQYQTALECRESKETDASTKKLLNQLIDSLSEARSVCYSFPSGDVILCEREDDRDSSQYYSRIYKDDICGNINKQIKAILRQHTIDNLRKAVYASRNWCNANPKKSIS